MKKHPVRELPYTPLNKRVFVIKDKPGEMKGSIFIPEKSRDHSYTGIVQAVGGEVTAVQPGQRVVFMTFAGSTIKMLVGEEEVELDILMEDEISGVENAK